MKKTKLFMLTIVVFSLAFAYNCKNEDTTGVGGVKPSKIYTNIPFKDDFDGKSGIPDSFWTLCWPEYTNKKDPAWNRFFKNTDGYECVKVENGILKLTAKKETGLWKGINYKTGGVWSSKNRYGIGTSIKVRAKLVQKEQKDNFDVPAAFPAIWYYPLFTTEWWPSSGEIDIMEYFSGKFHSTIHATNTNKKQHQYLHPTQTTNQNVTNWHVYQCDWYSNNIVIYYDSNEVFRHTNNFQDTYPFNDHCYNIILNASLLGGVWGAAVESNGNDRGLPYEMWVDWVEVSLIDKENGPADKNK